MTLFQIVGPFMAIQWYPGHMTSARKKAAETMASIDVVIEVVDARLPEASTNPMVRELRLHRQRPCLKVLNKADLADPQVTQAWIDYYNRQEGVRAVACRARNPATWRAFPDSARLWRRIAAKTPSRCG
jgi:ribosome biogenesis GTPase A